MKNCNEDVKKILWFCKNLQVCGSSLEKLMIPYYDIKDQRKLREKTHVLYWWSKNEVYLDNKQMFATN